MRKKKFFALIATMGISLMGATVVNATTAYTASNGINACMGMYGDARYEHHLVDGGELVTLSGNSNDELTGFYYDGMELFIQPWLLDINYGSSSASSVSYYDDDDFGVSSYSYTESSSGGAYDRIDLNLNTQWMKYYDWNGNMIFECHVVTGMDGHETPTGWFSIIYKESDTSLRGSNNGVAYDKHVDYWMPFYQWYDENGEVSSQAGFHDAGWKDVNSCSNKSGGSLGCVNMTPSDADTLYSLVSSGTTVYIHY